MIPLHLEVLVRLWHHLGLRYPVNTTRYSINNSRMRCLLDITENFRHALLQVIPARKKKENRKISQNYTGCFYIDYLFSNSYTAYRFSRCWHWFQVFPRFAPAACSALCEFSRDLKPCSRYTSNRPFSWWRHFTTTTIIPFVFPFLFNL